MARRSVWNGAVSFGMVAIPIKLYPATRSNDIRFVTLHTKCHQKMKQQRWCEHDNEVVDNSDTL